MTSEELQAFRDRFNDIMKSPTRIRASRLVTLMEDMEWTYHIPTLKDPEYEGRHPEIMKLYREVSDARF